MKFKIGRDNLALTVFVPWDCEHNCKFCTSKKDYKDHPADAAEFSSEFQRLLHNFSKDKVKEVVFTGGEPFMLPRSLEELVSKVKNRDVYINTTLPFDTYEQSMRIIQKYDVIKGVNISRHSTTFTEDCMMFLGSTLPASDAQIGMISKPVRINCILPRTTDLQVLQTFIEKVLKRWSKYKDVTVNFRADYRFITSTTLHSLDDEFFQCIDKMPNVEFVGQGGCNVCFTGHFYNYEEDMQKFMYHKGTTKSSIEFYGGMEVNDLILKQNGILSYDWDMQRRGIEDLYAMLVEEKPASSFYASTYSQRPVPRPSCGSGSSCGGSSGSSC